MKTGFRQKILLALLSFWTVCGIYVTVLYMRIMGGLVLRHMWMMGAWCSDDIYAEPTYCDHALYYGKVAVIVLFGVGVPIYFIRRILKGRN